MKNKLLPIDSCLRCTNMCTRMALGIPIKGTEFCMSTGKYIGKENLYEVDKKGRYTFNTFNYIPKWCPLEDEE